MENKKLDKKALIGIGALICFIVLCIVGIIFFSPNPTSQEQIKITNFNDYFSGAPSSRVNEIQALLYQTVSSNTDGDEDLSSVVGTIRSDGVVNDYDIKTDIHFGRFIVDIPSTAQSYAVSFDWASFSNNPNLSQYGVVVTCLEETNLIYGSFNCKDVLFSTNEDVGDAIAQYLPHSTLNYEMTYAGISGNLIVKIMLSASEERTDPNGAIEKYKDQAIRYIRSVGVNPDDYEIEWKIQRPTL